MAAPGLGAAGGVAADHQRTAVLGKISRISSFFVDLPEPGETNAVGMQQPPETFIIGAPAQIRPRIHSALYRLAKEIRETRRQDAAQNAEQRDPIDR